MGKQVGTAIELAGHLERPDWVRRINLFGIAVGDPARLVSLDADEMLAVAVESVGLSDFGDEPGWEAGYRALCGALDENAQLNVVGRLSARGEIIRNLQNRLRLVHYWQANPEALAAEVSTPVFVSGPPRTGTTILLELLALDPNLRGVRGHEAHFPLGTLPGTGADPLACSEPEQEFWADIQPEFMTMHELRGDLPVECIHFCQPEFRSWHWPMMHAIGDLAERGVPADFDAVYRWHKNFLQTLQHVDGAPAQFLLKSPAHMGTLPDLFAAYPNARVILTHRDPVRFVGSVANITTTMHWMRSDAVTPSENGPIMLFVYQMMMGMVMGQRASGEVPDDQIADLLFRDLMSDPVAAVQAAYDRLGLEFSDVLADAIPAYLAEKPKDKFGKHVYDPVALGLDESTIRAGFADYITHHNIPLEG